MRYLHVELEKTGQNIKQLEDLFNTILRESDYNLNQFVKGDAIGVAEKVSDDFLDNLTGFMELLPDIVKSLNDEDKEVFWSAFQKIDNYEDNEKFILWLQKYSDAVTKPLEETAFIKELDFETFKKMSDYCFQNLILQDVGKKRIDKTIGGEKQLLILKKALFTFCEMIISDNLSKENAFDNISRMFEMEESYCEVWWQYVKENEDKLWRIIMMKNYKTLEGKMEILLQLVKE